MKMNTRLLIAYKVFFALLGFAALVTEVAVLVDRGTFNLVNFLSFFTVQNNILVFITLLPSALVLASKKSPRWLDILRGLSTVYILVVGIGFAVLLSGLQGVALTAVPWDNTVLHYIIPVALLVDFIIDRPKKRISFKTGLVWIVYPLIYVAYSLIRGAITGWYPYPFLNPANGGYGSIATAVSGLVILGIALIWLVTWVSVFGASHSKKK